MVDSDLIGKGFGIAALGIGAGIALGAMRDVMPRKKKKDYDDDWFCFKPPRFRL